MCLTGTIKTAVLGFRCEYDLDYMNMTLTIFHRLAGQSLLLICVDSFVCVI